MSKLEEFYQKYGYAPVKKDLGVVDPNAKSKESLLEKVKRNIELDGNVNYNLSRATDMCRCTIICESFSQMPEVVTQLKAKFPDLNGYISRCVNGYRGVHLTMSIDGIPAEIQLSTKKAFEYAQAAEKIYQKWRSYNPRQKQEEIDNLKQMAENSNTPEIERVHLLERAKELEEKFKSESRQKAQEYSDTDNLFGELHEDGEFAKAEKDIEAVLLSFNMHKVDSNLDRDLFRQFKVVEGRLDEKEAAQFIDKQHKKSTKAQSKLVGQINEMLKSENKDKGVRDENVIYQIKLMTIMYDEIYKENYEAASPETQFQMKNKIRDFSIQKSKYAVDFAKFCQEKAIGIEDLNNNFFNEFVQQEALKNPQQDKSDLLLKLEDFTKVSAKYIKPKSVEHVSLNEIEQEKQLLKGEQSNSEIEKTNLRKRETENGLVQTNSQLGE